MTQSKKDGGMADGLTFGAIAIFLIAVVAIISIITLAMHQANSALSNPMTSTTTIYTVQELAWKQGTLGTPAIPAQPATSTCISGYESFWGSVSCTKWQYNPPQNAISAKSGSLTGIITVFTNRPITNSSPCTAIQFGNVSQFLNSTMVLVISGNNSTFERCLNDSEVT